MKGGGKWGERGREVGIGYPPVHPLKHSIIKGLQCKWQEGPLKVPFYTSLLI